MKTIPVVLAILIILVSSEMTFAQKSLSRRDAITIGLSYHVNEFYEEDEVVMKDLLEDGMFKDGLIGFNLQYIYRYKKLLGIAFDYKFLMGGFERGFSEYQQVDFAYGHQVFIGPAINLGKGVFNVTLRPQIGYDFLKIKGMGDWETSSSGGNISFYYTGSNPMIGMWSKILSDYDSSSQTNIIEGYPAYIRKGFLYQIGANFNFTWDKTSFTIFYDWSSMKYNDINHEEFGIGLGAMFHF